MRDHNIEEMQKAYDEAIKVFMAKYGKSLRRIRRDVERMLIEGDGDSLVLYDEFLRQVRQDMLKAARMSKAIRFDKNGLNIEDIAGNDN